MPKKLTQADFVAKAVAVHGVGHYDYSQTVYAGINERVKIICPAHGVFEQRATVHLTGSGCHKCGGSFKFTTADFIAKAKVTHGDKYDYSRVLYKSSTDKVVIMCPEHGDFEQVPSGHLGGSGCLRCSYEERGAAKKSNLEEFLFKARAIHGDKYDYSRVVYKSSAKKVVIICPVHGEFEQVPSSHLAGRGCAGCRSLLLSHRFRGDVTSFVAKARAVHSDKYDYLQVAYQNNHQNIVITCPEHGDFEQTPGNHLQGKGCSACALNSLSTQFKDTTESFLFKACAIHGDKYDYSRVVYKSSAKKVVIICPVHGEFEQGPGHHLQGKGCSICGAKERGAGLKSNLKEFLIKARAVHGDKYDYSQAVYETAIKKVVITCRVHGEFEQTPNKHLGGQACMQCGVALARDTQRQSWVERAGGRECTLYFIRLYSKCETFYKVGITYHSLKHRYRKKDLPNGYQYESLAVHKSTNAARIWEWEQSILETFVHLRYTPSVIFGGQTECFRSCEEILAVFPL
jgi:hypothetical protein